MTAQLALLSASVMWAGEATSGKETNQNCAKVTVAGIRGEKVKRGKRYKLPVMKSVSHETVTHSTGNIVNNIVTTLYHGRWSLDLCRDRSSHNAVHLKLTRYCMLTIF